VLFAEQCAPARREEKKGREGKEKEKKNTKSSQLQLHCVRKRQHKALRLHSRLPDHHLCRHLIYPAEKACSPLDGRCSTPPPSQCPVACIPTYLHTYIHT